MIVSDRVPWIDIPGSEAITRAVVAEMRRLDVTQYSQALEGATVSLLANDGLLSEFVSIVLNKTRYVFAQYPRLVESTTMRP